MSISGIYGATGSVYNSSFGGYRNSPSENNGESTHRNTGSDTVSFSQEALAKAQEQGGETAKTEREELSFKDKLALKEELPKSTARDNISSISKNSLLSMLLENLFLAELEESAANTDTANTENASSESEQPRTDVQTRQGSQAAKASNSLEDSDKITEIQKVLTEFTKGKADLSDVLKAMGNTSGSGAVKSVVHKNSSSTSSSADQNQSTDKM